MSSERVDLACQEMAILRLAGTLAMSKLRGEMQRRAGHDECFHKLFFYPDVLIPVVDSVTVAVLSGAA